MKRVFLIMSLALVSLSFYGFNYSDNVIEPDKKIEYPTDFNEGFEDGYCEGWKDVKGELALCPLTPLAPMPEISQSNDSYRDGYNTGFKAGMRAAHRN